MLKRLRDARERSRLTQVEVARALGTTQGFVSKCEQGERRIDPVELEDFAALYGAAIESLVPPAPHRVGPSRRSVAERPVKPVKPTAGSRKGTGTRSKKGQPPS